MQLHPSTLSKCQALIALQEKSKLNFLEHEPRTFLQASKHSEWKTMMFQEIKALHDNFRLTLVPKPDHANVIAIKWIYKIKTKSK